MYCDCRTFTLKFKPVSCYYFESVPRKLWCGNQRVDGADGAEESASSLHLITCYCITVSPDQLPVTPGDLPVTPRPRLPVPRRRPEQRWWICPTVVQCRPDTADTDRAPPPVITGRKRRKSRERGEESEAGGDGIKRTTGTTKPRRRISPRR